MAEQATGGAEAGLAPWLGGRPFAEWRAEYDETGYVVFESVLDAGEIARYRALLGPHLAADLRGRNDFEGLKSNRVYALLAKEPAFAELVLHPLALGFAEAELGASCLLSACLAINIQPGETAQPWHTDDGHIFIPYPRPSYGVSAFWTLDPMTEDNGATEVLPGSHRWGPEEIDFGLVVDALADKDVHDPDYDPAPHPKRVKATMPAGSLMLTKGSLWHRGGANRSDASRLIVTPQYCPGWARQLENMMATVPPDAVLAMPERARELLGYSIHPPFMGYVDGVHPRKTLPKPV